MRPEVLYPLFAPVTSLAGVGPKIAKLIEKLAGPHVVDLLWHLPNGLIDRRFTPKVTDAPAGVVATMTVRVLQHKPPPNKRLPYKVICEDDSGRLSLVFFHARPDYLNRILPEGETRVVSGKVEHFNNEVQITHPDHVGTEEEIAKLKRVEPTYPLTAGLSGKVLGRAMEDAVSRTPQLPEWQDKALIKQRRWPSWKEAVIAAHHPETPAQLEWDAPPRMRLAYDELLSNQLALALVRMAARKKAGRQIKGDRRLRDKLLTSLPFALTGGQEEALEEIDRDMADPHRMLRLLQGDVGSGKTIVALLAMLNAVEAGHQAALMAPTEILAHQHYETIQPLIEPLGLSAALLTGRESASSRKPILEALENGTVHIAVGTHTLFQEGVNFKDLAVAVIDEQHRFGVHQRLMLAGKGSKADVLVMTATPIPRTLSLTAYGDMDVSRLREKPAGRKPIDTRVIPDNRLNDVVSGLKRQIDGGARAYWVCPLVEDSETLTLANVQSRFEDLKKVFGDKVAMVHGRMKAAEKDAAMSRFASGDAALLVATTVIEVGVDVPEATIMVIEHAERFGLSQLHQMRGRIGRGGEKSSCILVYSPPLTPNARQRLEVMRNTDDGFVIAEEDLRLRGAGELLGTRQSGLPEFKVADLEVHGDLLQVARDDVKLVMERDPDLKSERGKALRVLLYLFERDAAVKYLSSG